VIRDEKKPQAETVYAAIADGLVGGLALAALAHDIPIVDIGRLVSGRLDSMVGEALLDQRSGIELHRVAGMDMLRAFRQRFLAAVTGIEPRDAESLACELVAQVQRYYAEQGDRLQALLEQVEPHELTPEAPGPVVRAIEDLHRALRDAYGAAGYTVGVIVREEDGTERVLAARDRDNRREVMPRHTKEGR
jgi:hypothetical protein